MTIKEALAQATTKIKKSSPSPALDSEVLLSYVLKKDRPYLHTYPEKELTKKQQEKLKDLTSQRAKHRPLAYLLGYREFYGYKFKVDERVLIPRPETELLVDLAVKKARTLLTKDLITIADVCTGSGCIAISIVKEILKDELFKKKQFKVIASDISPEALEVARGNARKLIRSDYSKWLTIVKSDLLAFHLSKKAEVDILVSNPPYVTSEEYKKIDKQIRLYEPRIALLSGKTHNKFIKKILEQVKSLPKKPEFIFIEGKNGEIKSYKA
jgi:release factor glutamine methyltransferase